MSGDDNPGPSDFQLILVFIVGALFALWVVWVLVIGGDPIPWRGW